MSSRNFDFPPVNGIPDYQYEELKTPDEIRLITIVHGDFDDDIVLRIFHDFLKSPSPEPPRMSMRELEETLPNNWKIDETEDGRFIFIDMMTGETFWNHPDSTIDQSRYLPSNPDSEPKYEALSYTWGDLPDGGNSGMIPVYIQTSRPDSRPTENAEPGSCFAKLLVTSNLAIALRHFRVDKTRALPIWIDAISINQASFAERNTQVLHMTDIYRLAHKVIVWLGPSSSNSGRAVGNLSRLGKQFVTSRKRGFENSPDTKEVPKWDEGTALPYHNDTWTAIEEFFHRPWFRRLWVVQEIQLARNAVVYCGLDKIPWDWLWQAANFMRWNDHKPSSITEIAELVRDLGHKA